MDIEIKYNLYDERIKRGHTIRSLSQVSGVSKSNINDIENQRINPSVRAICMLAVALDTDPCDLFEIR